MKNTKQVHVYNVQAFSVTCSSHAAFVYMQVLVHKASVVSSALPDNLTALLQSHCTSDGGSQVRTLCTGNDVL